MKTKFILLFIISIFCQSNSYAAATVATVAVGAVLAGADATSYGANCATGRCRSTNIISKDLSDELIAENTNSIETTSELNRSSQADNTNKENK